MVVGFVLLAITTPRKMSGWDFPRRQTETGKTPILLTTTRYSQVTNLFFTFERSVALYDDTSFSSPGFFLLYGNRVTLSRLLVKKLVAKRMRERRSRKRRRRRRMECVALKHGQSEWTFISFPSFPFIRIRWLFLILLVILSFFISPVARSRKERRILDDEQHEVINREGRDISNNNSIQILIHPRQRWTKRSGIVCEAMTEPNRIQWRLWKK